MQCLFSNVTAKNLFTRDVTISSIVRRSRIVRLVRERRGKFFKEKKKRKLKKKEILETQFCRNNNIDDRNIVDKRGRYDSSMRNNFTRGVRALFSRYTCTSCFTDRYILMISRKSKSVAWLCSLFSRSVCAFTEGF